MAHRNYYGTAFEGWFYDDMVIKSTYYEQRQRLLDVDKTDTKNILEDWRREQDRVNEQYTSEWNKLSPEEVENHVARQLYQEWTEALEPANHNIQVAEITLTNIRNELYEIKKWLEELHWRIDGRGRSRRSRAA